MAVAPGPPRSLQGQLLYAVRIPKALSLRPLSLAVHPAVRAGPGALPEFPGQSGALCSACPAAPPQPSGRMFGIFRRNCFASITRPPPSSWAPPTPVSGGHSQGPSTLPPPPASPVRPSFRPHVCGARRAVHVKAARTRLAAGPRQRFPLGSGCHISPEGGFSGQ